MLLSVFCCASGCRWSSTKAFLIGFVVTFFPLFDVPVFWPILLLYWFILAFITMKRQIKHMIKYRYVPFSWGKKVSPAPSSFALTSKLWADCLNCCAQREKYEDMLRRFVYPTEILWRKRKPGEGRQQACRSKQVVMVSSHPPGAKHSE